MPEAQTALESSKKTMLRNRLNQAKRKLAGSMSERVYASKKYKNNFADDQTILFPADDKIPHVCELKQPNLPLRPLEMHSNLKKGSDLMNKDSPKFTCNMPNHAGDIKPVKSAGVTKRIDHGLFVEIFAGSAGLTAAVRKVGLSASVGVDSSVSTKCRAPVIRLDLRQSHAQTLMWQILSRPNLIGVHLAPPCGTASRAREIVRKSGSSPKPLRSDQYPDGYPWLRGTNRDRVSSANALYDITGQVLAYCLQHNIVVSVENPARSHFWNTTHFSRHIEGLKHLLFETFFHHCMHGSRRRKHTLLLHNCPHLCKLAILCDNSHVHEKWGYDKTWATSLETAYPPLLCKRYADLLHCHLQAVGYKAMPVELNSDDSSPGHNNKFSQIGADKQPKGKKIPPLVSEFQKVVTLKGPCHILPQSSKFACDWRIPDRVHCSDPSLTVVPAHARVLKSLIYGDDGDRKFKDSQATKDSDIKTNDCDIKEISVGIQWSPNDFVTRALAKEHPKAAVKVIPSELANTIDKSITISASDLSKERTAVSRKWFLRATELRDCERALKDAMPEHCAKVLHNKRLVVFEEMLKSSGYKDTHLVSEISKGFDLMGDLPKSHVFVHRETFATLTPQQVRESACMNRQAIVASVARPMDAKIRKGVYEATMKELDAGWITGPIPMCQLDEFSVCTRRFGVIQHSTESNGDRVEKVRPIDDFTESLVNLTNGARRVSSFMGSTS